MTYKIKWHPQAFKILKKLPKAIIERVLAKLDILKENPFRFLEHFEGNDLYKLRIGEYRALLEFIPKEELFLVKLFNHRKRIYKR
jgi:mRNA-degrading endonuclease RelE of RelBE toxin-antitoxin system